MAESNIDEKEFKTALDSSGKENYDRLLSVFHTGTDVKRSLLEQYLGEKHLNLLDWLTDLNQTFLKFDDVKRAIKRSSTIDLKDLELSTIDILLKFNCFDLFWDVCLLNTRLEEILNGHKYELLEIYQTSMTQYDLPSSSTNQYTPSLTKTQWEILFKSRECRGIRKEINVADISATKDITLSSLDETLNVLLLRTVCPLYKSVQIVSECQIQILKIAVIYSACEGFTFENLWNRIESHIISIASHCKLSDYFKRKCETTKQTIFNRNFSQDNRKCILEDAFNHPDFIRQNQFCNRVRKELDLIHLDDNLNLARKLCGKGIPILLVDGKYTNGTYSLSVVESADKDLQVVKSVCSHQVMKADQNETEDDIQTDDIQKRINMHSHLKVVQLITNIAKDVLVDVLKCRLPCANFGYAFNGMKNRIFPQLNNHGRQLLYPDGSSYSGDLSDLDISLIYTILRNMNTIVPQLNGWGNMPKDTDRSLSANIDRIRFFKNNYVSHCSNLSLDEQNFLQTWKEISKCIIELGGDDYIRKIDSILTAEINYVMEKELCNTIRRLKEADRQNELNYNSLKEDLNEIKQHLSMTTKPPTVNATASNGLLGSVPLELRIEGESIPLVEEIKKRTDNLSSDDMQVTFAKEGSVIIGLKVSPSALYTVGNFLGIIDTLLSKLLQMNEHYGNGHTTRIVVSVNFMDEQNEPIGFAIKQNYGVVSTNQLQKEKNMQLRKKSERIYMNMQLRKKSERIYMNAKLRKKNERIDMGEENEKKSKNIDTTVDESMERERATKRILETTKKQIRESNTVIGKPDSLSITEGKEMTESKMENCEPQLRDDIKRYLRLACLLLHIAPRALRRHFDHEFHPDKLQKFLVKKQNKILELKQRRCITQTQYELLYPAGELSSTNFDMTLMTFLLRNFTDLSFSDKLPSDHLIDLGSDISRLVHYRNVIVHSKDGCVSEDESRTVWDCVSLAIKRLAQEPLCKGEISSLLESTLSGPIDVASIQQDVNQQRQLDELTERVLKLETENINRSEIRRKTISNWSEEDKKFVRTKILELVTKTLTTRKAVILVGHAGCGKSATAKHVALKLRKEEGYEIEEIYQPDDVVKYYNSKTKQLFLIEDICGKFSIDQQKADQWTENDSKIETLLKPNTNNKFLITTRVSIYKSECFPQLKCLDIKEFSFAGITKLSHEEMRSIALSYLPRDIVNGIDDSTFNLFPFFPLMCKIYSNMTEQDPNFFKYPIELIKQEVNYIKQRHESSFVALCLLVLHNNALDKKNFESNSSVITDCLEMIIRETKENCDISLVKIEQSLKHNLPLFVTENGSEYVAIHDKMFDIISAVLIPLMFKSVIKFGDNSLLSSRIQLCSLDEKPNDFVQLLPTELESSYFDRLCLDIAQGYHWDVFGNIQTRFPQYRELFLNNLRKMQIKVTTLGNDGSTPLFVSAYKGYEDFVEYLVDKFTDQVFQRDEHNRSPLYIACKQGHVGVVKKLLLFDKDVHQLQNRNCTPFYISCQMGHLDIAKLLFQHDSIDKSDRYKYKNRKSAACKKDEVKKGAHDNLINKPMDTGVTPLMAAAYNGHTDVVTFLLDINVALDSADHIESTALHYACLKNHADIVRLLVSHGAEVDPVDQKNQTPFYMSCCYGHMDIIKLLLFGNEPIKRSIGSKKSTALLSDNSSLFVPLSYHSLHINKCVDLNVKDVEGDTALHAACFNGHFEVMKLLIQIGMNVNEGNCKGQTPLMMACANGFFNIAKLLIDNNANINQSDNEKFTPLLYASNSNLDTVELLIKHNCDIDAKNCDGSTALHQACSNGHAQIVDILIGNGANINACDRGGKTPLFYAARNNKVDVIELVLSRGANVDYWEEGGVTPLQGACKYGHIDAVVSLLKHNADVNAARCPKLKPIILAKEGSFFDIVEILEEQLKKIKV